MDFKVPSVLRIERHTQGSPMESMYFIWASLQTEHSKTIMLLTIKMRGLSMKTQVFVLILGALLIACAGCASNPDAAGQALSGVLMGIGQGLSGL